MPGMNGLELLEELTSVLPPSVPRGICSARRAPEVVEELGVSFVVRKSGSTRELVDALRRALPPETAETGVERPRVGVGSPAFDETRRTGEFHI
jgi:DNA-binding NarL/FixJ family response regulator